MKRFKRNSVAIVLAVLLVLDASNFNGRSTALAATTPSLGAAATYGLLATTYTNTTATTINGDVGFTVAPTTPPSGTHTNYGSGGAYAAAGTAQISAASALAAQGCTFSWGAAVDLSADASHGTVGVFTPGVYCSTGAMSITSSITLSGSGTYIFRPTGAFDTVAGATITLAGASACDIFWTPSGATTLGAGTNFAGTIIDDAAVTVGAGTTWTGRVLAFNGPVTTATTTITVPTCTATLNVIKDVVNNSGGSTTASGFSLHVKLAGTDVAGSPSAGAATPGTPYTLAPGTYVVSEDSNASYARSFSGDCDASGTITLAYGDTRTCTITNDDIAPATITVVKLVINDNGRSKTVADFPLFVNSTAVTSGATNTFAAPATYTVTETADPNYDQAFSGDCDSSGHISLTTSSTKICVITNDDIGAPVIVPPVPPLIAVVKVPSPLNLPGGPGPVVYNYTLRNTGTVAVSDITMVDDTCSVITLVSGDTDSDDRLDVNETWRYRCSMTLSQTHTNVVVATGLGNGLTATDVATATVVVGEAIVPPLIHVTKIPTPLTLSANGGAVTFTETLTNLGTVALQNILLNDSTCDPVDYRSGDKNGDAMLDPTETWIYTCRMDLTKTTTNTVIASGEANGLTAIDFAIATVVVATGTVPGLPNTGYPPEGHGSPATILLVPGRLLAFAQHLRTTNRVG